MPLTDYLNFVCRHSVGVDHQLRSCWGQDKSWLTSLLRTLPTPGPLVGQLPRSHTVQNLLKSLAHLKTTLVVYRAVLRIEATCEEFSGIREFHNNHEKHEKHEIHGCVEFHENHNNHEFQKMSAAVTSEKHYRLGNVLVLFPLLFCFCHVLLYKPSGDVNFYWQKKWSIIAIHGIGWNGYCNTYMIIPYSHRRKICFCMQCYCMDCITCI